ncbi:MAG: cytochrome c biogenesis protein [Dehalococcoidia bacterium]
MEIGERRSFFGKLTWLDGLFGITAVAFLVDIYLIFLWVPTEAQQGPVQRIFYFHLPAGWIAYLAFFLVFFFSIFHLRSRNPRWDHYAYSAAELGVVFTSVTIVTGIIWAKPIFGVWWVWDARLTTTALMWLIYVGYLMVGAYAVSQGKASRLRAAVGILGFAVVPINYLSVRLWKTIHVEPIVAGGDDSYLYSDMYFTLIFSVVAFTLLFAFLLALRVMMRESEAALEELSNANEGADG